MGAKLCTSFLPKVACLHSKTEQVLEAAHSIVDARWGFILKGVITFQFVHAQSSHQPYNR